MSRRVTYLRATIMMGLLSWAAVFTLGSQQHPTASPTTTGTVQSTAPQNAAQDPATLAEGQAMFRGLCSGCHGGAGRGGKGPDLTDNRWIHGSSDADIARVIENGVPNTTMKKLGDALKPAQIRTLIGYIRSLARSPGESTWKPYMPGDAQRGPKDLLRSTRKGAVCEVSPRRRRRGPNRAGT